MPILYWGYHDSKDRRLLSKDLREIESSLFDHFKVNGIAPYPSAPFVAHFWAWTKKQHNFIAWDDLVGREHIVVIPGPINKEDALRLARDTFGKIIPSPLVFRWAKARKVYIYD